MTCKIDGREFPVIAPESIEQLRQVVRDAAQQATAIYPVGGRTMLDFGLSPARDGMAVETTRLDRVIDYPSRDMTITVQAGIRIEKLQGILRAEGQQLPVDVPRAAEATLGGAIATNTSGLRRYGYGTLRDYVIGISVVDSDGNETKAGGRVVKNVAGYDLCKLYTGSFGTLGIIAQVTLKLKPLAPRSAVRVFGFGDLSSVNIALERIAASRTRPTCIELLNAEAARRAIPSTAGAFGAAAWAIVVGFEEIAEAVAWQEQQLDRELADLRPDIVSLKDTDQLQLLKALVEMPGFDCSVRFKANHTASGTGAFAQRVADQSIGWGLQSHAGNGITTGQLHSVTDQHATEASLGDLCQTARNLRGNLVIERCPTVWKSGLMLWGSPRDDAWLMRGLRTRLDPRGLFNPGRFVV